MATKKINLDRHIGEGWTVKHFIESLSLQVEMIQSGRSWQKPIKTKLEMKAWCVDNQPYYKKHIPEVVDYFCEKYDLK